MRPELQTLACVEVPLSRTVIQAMTTRSPFEWPLFPGDLYHLGLSAPEQPQLFHDRGPQPVPGDRGCVDNSGSSSESSGAESDDVNASDGVRYPASTMMKFLELQSLLKPGASIRRVCALAAELLGHDPAAAFDAEVFKVPSGSTMRRALVKVDMHVMLSSRHQWRKGYTAVCGFLADSSEQHHHNYLCQRVDAVVVPPGMSAADRKLHSVQHAFARSLLPPGTLGYGEADAAHKLRLVLHFAKLTTGSQESLLKWRRSIRGMCSDQGLEVHRRQPQYRPAGRSGGSA